MTPGAETQSSLSDLQVGQQLKSAATESGLSRVIALDGVRGLAILLVVFWHYYACVPRPEWVTTIPLFESLAGYAWTGVPLFFVLSGFLIGRILIQQRGQPSYYRVFFLRRAVRILPLYFVALAAFAITRELLPPTENPALLRLFGEGVPFWSHLVFAQNFFMAQQGHLGGEWLGVTWSLAVEEQFYLLLPFIVAVVRPGWLRPAVVGLILFGIIFRLLALRVGLGTPAALIVLLPSRIDGFAAGMLIATQRGPWIAPAAGRWIAALGVIACVWLIYLGRSASSVYLAGVYTLIAVGYACVIWHVVSSARGRVAGLFAWKPLTWLGGVSYFVYLFHQPVNHLAHFTLRSEAPNLANAAGLAVTVCAFAIVLIGGELSRRWFEGPLIAWGKRWQYGRSNRQDVPQGSETSC